MAVHRVSFLALVLLFGMSLLVSNVEHADAKACPFNCDPRIAYGVCPRLEEDKNNQICTNCCAGTKGCNYFSTDGTFICKGESDPRNPKACPRNCDPRIAYGLCPLSKEKDNRICINCCAGTKGCNYFSADGTFVCKGESDPRNPKVCPLNCDPRIAYGLCPLSEEKKDNQICTNCCAGTKGCNYFSANGTFVCKGESDPRNPKACPRNCDPRIAYGLCPLSEEKKDNRICTNCCAGKKGCNYFSADGTFVCKGESDPRNPKVCPRNCDPRIDYRVCPRSEEKNNQICTNCCAGTKGCNYFSADGTFVCEGESDPRNPKACPRNCDPRIDYRVCPYSEEKNNQICTNCCAGTKGCNYFSANGTFICNGESEYISKVDE